ncbi:YceI family protein [Winogradskyella sp.]|uniref:YceI family protein n=1 Tax=Winogradskyella sp. TaxID=1883156 RepID=UPI002612E145|nr:YceI family protein [Winogradskyella sp.]
METITKTTWNVDNAHSEIGFKVKHMMISTVSGHFEDFTASVETETEDFNNAQFSFSAKVNSINTKNNDRDNHLRSEDFFNVSAFPEMTFTSKSFDGSKIIGNLTIKDVTKEVTLNTDFNGLAVDPYGQTKAGFEISGSISRKEFGLTWNAVTEAGSVVVGDTIKLVIELQFIKK